MHDVSMLQITATLSLPIREVDIHQIRAQGAGGQNVNKVATAVHLRFDIRRSSLPDFIKNRLLALPDKRISQDGIIVIKGQHHRSYEKNRLDALKRLGKLIESVTTTPKKRRPTQPSKASKKKRLEKKKSRSQTKTLRKKVIL